MLLPPQFRVFVISLGARPYQAKSIPGFSEQLEFSTAYGLSGIYQEDTGELHIQIGQRQDQLDLSTVVTGTVGVYRSVPDKETDYLIQEITLSPDLLKTTTPRSWSVIVRTEVPASELVIGCILTTADSYAASWAAVEAEAWTKHVQLYRERFRTSQDVLPENQSQTIIFTESDSDKYVDLDFTLPDNPVRVQGQGVLTYTGGGNRYLPGQDGTVLQQLNQAPWLLNASTFLEPGSSQYLTDPEQTKNLHRINTGVAMSTTKRTSTWDYPGYNELTFTVSGALGLDSYWEWESESVPVPMQTLTGSAFVSVTTPAQDRVFDTVFGVRVRSNAGQGSVVSETVSLAWTGSALTEAQLLQVQRQELNQSATTQYLSCFIRVSSISPGDRVQVTVAAPQLEPGTCASSRTRSGQVRVQDRIVFTPTQSLYDYEYAVFEMTAYPAYSGTPTTTQCLFDTRDSNGRNGVYAKHLLSGTLVCCVVDDDGNTYQVESASVYQLVYGTRYRFRFWFDTNHAGIRVNDAVVGTKTFAEPVPMPDFPVLVIGSSYLYAESFTGELEAFSLQAEPTQEQ